MKNPIIYSVVAFVLLFTTTAIQNDTNNCDARVLKNETLENLNPDYKYDSSKITQFLYSDREQTVEIEAPLFKGEEFRFIFNTAGMPKDIQVKFFDKKIGTKNRKELYSLQKKDGKNIYFFDPLVSKKIYLDYILPRTSQQNLEGCMVCVIGYKINPE